MLRSDFQHIVIYLYLTSITPFSSWKIMMGSWNLSLQGFSNILALQSRVRKHTGGMNAMSLIETSDAATRVDITLVENGCSSEAG